MVCVISQWVIFYKITELSTQQTCFFFFKIASAFNLGFATERVKTHSSSYFICLRGQPDSRELWVECVWLIQITSYCYLLFIQFSSETKHCETSQSFEEKLHISKVIYVKAIKALTEGSTALYVFKRCTKWR